MTGSNQHSIRAREAISRIEGQRHGWHEGDLNDFAIIEEALDEFGHLEEQLQQLQRERDDFEQRLHDYQVGRL